MIGNSLHDWFFMRNGFDTFHLEPERHRQLLFGSLDRERRDRLLDKIEDACCAREGHKSVIYGDYGRGKTHQCKNVIWALLKREVAAYPVYVKATEYKSKEPFSSLFRSLLLALPSAAVQAMATEYARQLAKNHVASMTEVTGSEEIGLVFEQGLAAPNLDIVRRSMKYLGGETDLDMTVISDTLTPRLTVSREFGAVMKGLVQLFREIGIKERTVPMFLIDEAERLSLITNTDAYWSWLAALRELTEIHGVGFIFFVGAKSEDTVPEMLLQPEIRTRIGDVNYVELYNPDKAALRDFLLELFETLLRKGPVPAAHREAMKEYLQDGDVDSPAPELAKEAKKLNESVTTFPFTKKALEEFIESCSQANLANKPREVLIRLQKAATRALRKSRRYIDSGVLAEIAGE